MADANAQTAIDMKRARERTSFEVLPVTHLLWNGPQEFEARQKVVEIVSKDPVFDKATRPFDVRADRYKRGLAMMKRLGELADQYGWSDKDYSVALNLADDPLPLVLHYVAFMPVLLSQGSPEQVAQYGARAAHRGIIGCYAQTELGHGTNVQKLETTATFIPDTDEFEIHSPTLTSTKWWVGGMGKIATHAVVQAQLILPGGKEMGPHLFIVQLRSLDDHQPLKGVTLGDIGPKAFHAFAAVDHGFARFDHVRVPRNAMLSKFSKVSRDGQYMQPPHAKLSYGGMLYIRSTMITTAGWTLAKGITISIRYSTVRRQGGQGPDGLEKQVITYPSVHYRLLPLLAKSYVFILLGRSMTKLFESMSSRLAGGDTSLLAETHAISSGLKVLVSTQSVEGLEVARRAMGGHGFNGFSGVGRIWREHVPSATFEGDNYVLDFQVVRAAVKSWSTLQPTKDVSKLSPSSAFLRHLVSSRRFTFEALWDDPATAVSILELRAAHLVQSYEQAVRNKSIAAGEEARVSQAISEAFVAARMGEAIVELDLPHDSKIVVGRLLKLYLLTTVEAALADVLAYSLLPSASGQDPTVALRLSITRTCAELLPDAIGLTDAFALSDFELDSALGVKDGRVYEALYEKAKAEPLNATEVPEGYEQYIKPILERGKKLSIGSKL